MRESTLENKIKLYVEQLGGKAYKWTSPGTRGVPDRIVILPKGRIVFVEVKRPGLQDGLSIRQKKIRATLESLGCKVWRISDFEEFKERIHGI